MLLIGSVSPAHTKLSQEVPVIMRDESIRHGRETMPTLTLTDEQVIELVKQLPLNKQEELFKVLLTWQWGAWQELSRYGEERVRMAATVRGRNWDAMTEEEREAFIDDLVHEDRL